MNEVYAGLIRHTLTVVCGILVSKGAIDASNAEIAVVPLWDSSALSGLLSRRNNPTERNE